MSDLLAVITEDEQDEAVLAEISRRHPTRVTVLLDTDEPDPLLADAATSDRLAGLLDAIERNTGATVVGLAGSREQLEGWRFDRVVGAEAR